MSADVTIESAPDVIESSTVGMRYSAADSAPVIERSLDGAAWVELTAVGDEAEDVIPNLADGVHDVEVRASGDDGVTFGVSKTHRFYVFTESLLSLEEVRRLAAR